MCNHLEDDKIWQDCQCILEEKQKVQDQIQQPHSPRRQEGESGYIQVCNKGSRQSEHQRSGIKLRNVAFCVWDDVSLWAHWVHSFHRYLSYLGPILFPSSPCFLCSPSSSAIPVGVAASLDHSLGSPHLHLEARNCWRLQHFLFIDMAGDIFISQTEPKYWSGAIFPTCSCLREELSWKRQNQVSTFHLSP